MEKIEVASEQKIYEDPFWINKEQKQLMVVIHYPETGRKTPASISGEGNNPDYEDVLKQFTIEEIDEYTARREERKAREAQARQDRAKVEQARRMDEALFESKLQAFEIPLIKNSTNKALKAKIRRSKSFIEVQAYATMLIMEEEKVANDSK